MTHRMDTLVYRREASSTDFIEPCVSTDGHLGAGGLAWPPSMLSRHGCHKASTSLSWCPAEKLWRKPVANPPTTPNHNYRSSNEDEWRCKRPIGGAGKWWIV